MFVTELFLEKKRNFPDPKIPDFVLLTTDDDLSFPQVCPVGADVPRRLADGQPAVELSVSE